MSRFNGRMGFAKGELGFAIGCIVLLLAAWLVFAVVRDSIMYGNQTQTTVTICGKESVQSGDSHEYRVYTSGGTYKVADYKAVQDQRFDSADLYGRLQVDASYTITTIGWRIPFFSVFQNIIKVEAPVAESIGTCETVAMLPLIDGEAQRPPTR